MLHLVFQSSLGPELLQRFDTDDAVVFLENSVLRLMQNSYCANALSQRLAKVRFYALAQDLATRGIIADEIIPGIQIIDYAALVKLSIDYTPIQSWFC
jgi:sulfur relay protein TusB/DsrH